MIGGVRGGTGWPAFRAGPSDARVAVENLFAAFESAMSPDSPVRVSAGVLAREVAGEPLVLDGDFDA